MTKMLHGVAKGRTLHVVDLENLMGDDRFDGIADAVLCRYLELARWTEGDQVLIASHPKIIEQIAFDPPVPCSLHAVHGNDAADVMLLAHAPAELIARRFDRLVIGSGDAIFVPRARAIRDRGIGVLVISRPAGVAEKFRRWAFPVQNFDAVDLDTTMITAA